MVDLLPCPTEFGTPLSDSYAPMRALGVSLAARTVERFPRVPVPEDAAGLWSVMAFL